MTRRRFYAPPASFSPDGQFVTLDEDEARHLRDVLRLRPGDGAHVFDGRGREYACVVETVARRGAARLRIESETEPARPESPLDLTLALALLKGEKYDLVVQKATELGVTRLQPLATRRADVRLRDERDAEKRIARHARLTLEAAKQSGRALLPEMAAPTTFAEFIARDAGDDLRIMFAERGGEDFDSLPANVRSAAALVGPEGGWADEEIAAARDAGWKIVTCGGRILRAETAAIVFVALLQHAYGDLH